ncbi:disulfide bond formation protein B [Acuticoccus sp. I52.16.1]|uniref:disulfide bond formation protein B n=1 Tax=Acuticoccus sp. I52.16.1 TaxID=2928472 RepID=UPI001FD60CBD|nr:disulfide bond formation protein B [Acuticoccus sp. I52.16.1]UOM33963.1 disulfide bond formation protein B [Acuticoccus sp. I52.16.1]
MRRVISSAFVFAALIVMVVAIAAVWTFQLQGFQPCPLCLEQRTGYYLAIPLALAALALRGPLPRLATLLTLLAAAAIAWSAGLGVYHAGAEWGYWPGPSTCAGGAGGADIFDNPGGLLGALDQEVVVSCTEVQGRLFGLSFAGWNVLSAGTAAVLLLLSATFGTRHEAVPAAR